MALSEYLKAAFRPKIIIGIAILAFAPVFMLFNQEPETSLPVSSLVVVGIFFLILLFALWTDIDKAVKKKRKEKAQKTEHNDPAN